MKDSFPLLALGLLVPALAQLCPAADSLRLSASLAGSQEASPVDSDAVGEAVLEIDPTTRDFVLSVTVIGLEPGDLTGAHLHSAPPGVNGPVIVPFDVSLFTGDANLLTGQFTASLDAEDLGDLLAGNVYLNLHTTDRPGGEIRGQLFPVSGTGNQILNLSCRGMINPGNGKAGILIGGFVIDEPGETVLVRCIGDGLTKWGLNSLKDTALSIYDVDGNLIAQNDDWKKDGQEFNILSTGFAPDRDSDAALVRQFPAGAYTVHARSRKGAGIALVDIYGVSAKTVGGIIDASANGSENAGFTILNGALKDTGLDGILDGPGPFTLFAPTDAAFEALPAGTLEAPSDEALTAILKYHLVAASLPSGALTDGPLNTVLGEAIEIDLGSGVRVNDATVIGADLFATNGVVHVIDTVLIPPPPAP